MVLAIYADEFTFAVVLAICPKKGTGWVIFPIMA